MFIPDNRICNQQIVVALMWLLMSCNAPINRGQHTFTSLSRPGGTVSNFHPKLSKQLKCMHQSWNQCHKESEKKYCNAHLKDFFFVINSLKSYLGHLSQKLDSSQNNIFSKEALIQFLGSCLKVLKDIKLIQKDSEETL